MFPVTQLMYYFFFIIIQLLAKNEDLVVLQISSFFVHSFMTCYEITILNNEIKKSTCSHPRINQCFVTLVRSPHLGLNETTEDLFAEILTFLRLKVLLGKSCYSAAISATGMSSYFVLIRPDP